MTHDLNLSTIATHADRDPARDTLELLRHLTPVTGPDEQKRVLDKLLSVERPTTLGFLNAHATNLCRWNAQGSSAFLRLDVLLRDGAGVELMLRVLGQPSGDNMTGTDFIPRLLAAAGHRSVACFGARADIAREATRRWSESGVNIVATLDGYQSSQDYLDAARLQRPQIIVLAMGMPMQEQLANLLRSRLDFPTLIVCGGAILDFHSGAIPRAPRLMRRCRLEWLYRLYLEPRRLFHRYVVGIPLFLMHLRHVRRASLQRAGSPEVVRERQSLP